MGSCLVYIISLGGIQLHTYIETLNIILELQVKVHPDIVLFELCGLRYYTVCI